MNDVTKSKQRLQNDLKKLVADTKDLLESTADVADNAAKSARERVEASLQTVQEQVESGISAAGGLSIASIEFLLKRNLVCLRGPAAKAGLIGTIFRSLYHAEGSVRFEHDCLGFRR